MEQNSKQKTFDSSGHHKKHTSITFTFANPHEEESIISFRQEKLDREELPMLKKKSSVKLLLKNLDFFFQKSKSKLDPHIVSSRFYQSNYKDRQIPMLNSFQLMQNPHKKSYKNKQLNQPKLRIKLEIINKNLSRNSIKRKQNLLQTPVNEKKNQYFQVSLTQGNQCGREQGCCNEIRDYLHNKFKSKDKTHLIHTIQLSTERKKRSKSRGINIISPSLSGEKTRVQQFNYSPINKQSKNSNRSRIHTITLRGNNNQSTKKIKIRPKNVIYNN